MVLFGCGWTETGECVEVRMRRGKKEGTTRGEIEWDDQTAKDKKKGR